MLEQRQMLERHDHRREIVELLQHDPPVAVIAVLAPGVDLVPHPGQQVGHEVEAARAVGETDGRAP